MLSLVTLVQSQSDTNNSCLFTIRDHCFVLGDTASWATIISGITGIIAIIPVIISGYILIKKLIKSESSNETSDSQIRRLFLSRLDENYSERRHDSLHNLIKIDLQIEEQNKRVGRHKSELIPEDTPQFNFLESRFLKVKRFFKNLQDSDELTPLSSTQKTIEFYERDDVGKKLLILGDPGGGKTTELLSLADDLVKRAKANEEEAIPVILELSAWKVNQSFSDWLVNQVHEIYGLGKATAKRWLDSGQFIFLLDGLDELGLVNETKCIEVINQFLVDKLQPGLVVCCRKEEYELSEVRLEKLQGAIYLQELTDEQIDQYLRDLKRSRLWQNLQEESELLELARSPLFLSMLAVAYQGNIIRNPQELCEAYIKKQIKDPKCQGTYPPGKNLSPEKSLYYLVWLAKKLEEVKETEFLIEKMQPSWLKSSREKLLYPLSIGLIYGLITTGIILLFYLLIGELTGRLREGLVLGLIGGLFGGLIIGFMGWLVTSIDVIYFQEQFYFSLNKCLMIWLIVGLILGSIIGWVEGLILGLSCGLFLGITYGVSEELSWGEIPTKKIFNQVIWLSFKNGIFELIIIGLSSGLIFGVLAVDQEEIRMIYRIIGGLFMTLLVGWFMTIFGGLIAVIQHCLLRLILYRNGYIPWHYSRFLNHAAKHRFIQRVGGRYRFMHDLLRKQFARMPLDKRELRKFLN